MKITSIRLRKDTNDKIKGFADVVFDDCFVVDNIKIIDGKKGMFIAFPSYKHADEFKDICHPINQETRMYIQEEVINAFEKEFGDN